MSEKNGDLVKLAEKWLEAAKNMDWQQVVMNGGPPCFYYDGVRFCGRAERWEGHEEGRDHSFVSLASLLASYAAEVEAGKWVAINSEDDLPKDDGEYIVASEIYLHSVGHLPALFNYRIVHFEAEKPWKVTGHDAYRPIPQYVPAQQEEQV